MPRLNLACACGATSWVLDENFPRSGIRYICHCDDCQAFAHFLEQPDSILDSQGGTDVYQLAASRIHFSTGLDRLRCVQVTARPLLRWYCADCRTPIANTYHTAKLSFASMLLCAIPLALRDQALGPPSGHAWTKFGHGDLSHVKQTNIPAMIWRMASRIVYARLTGNYRRNPFFDPDTGKPLSGPRCITPAERAELDRKVRDQ
jgi:hypothetical protein